MLKSPHENTPIRAHARHGRSSWGWPFKRRTRGHLQPNFELETVSTGQDGRFATLADRHNDLSNCVTSGCCLIHMSHGRGRTVPSATLKVPLKPKMRFNEILKQEGLESIHHQIRLFR